MSYEGLPCGICGSTDKYSDGRCRGCKRLYYKANRDASLKRNAMWEINNRAIRKSIKQRRRARLRSAPGSFTGEEWFALCKLYDFTCLSCMKRIGYVALTADHVVPLSVGGDNWLRNIQPLCQSCNSSKHTKTIDYRTLIAIPEERLLEYVKEERESEQGKVLV